MVKNRAFRIPPPAKLRIVKGFKGFTLAEVLITLGIIGVVAALTIPTLIAKYQEKVLITAAKKSYSTIYNAINSWCQKNGELGNYEYFWTSQSNNTEIINELAKELNAVNVCTSSSNITKCGGKYDVKKAKKTNDGKGNTATEQAMNSRRIVLADGSFISAFTEVQNGGCTHTYFSPERDPNGNYIEDSSSPTGYKGEYKSSPNCGFIHIDTNGLKGPNQVGKDYFIIGTSGKALSSTSDTYGNLNYVLSHDKLIETENYKLGKY